MTVSKIRLPDNTEHDIRAKYLIRSSSSDAVSEEFVTKVTTEDAIANIQKIYGNTVVVSNNLVSNSATAILSRGFNQWDEEWENGEINTATGQNTGSTYVRSKNYIPCIPSSTYCFSKQSKFANVRAFQYSADKSFIRVDYFGGGSTSFTYTISDNCYYLRFYVWADTSYANDICINISDPAKNGTYEPYNGHQIDLNIPTLTGKLNGAGSSVVIFPGGMKKAGVIQDEVSATATKRVMGIDLGALTWSYNSTLQCFRARNITGMVYTSTNNCICAPYISVTNSEFQLGTDKAVTISARSIFGDGTADIAIRDTSYGSNYSNFKTAMDGVYLYAEMSTPQEYILDNALQLQYPVVAGGTEMVLPTSWTAPMKMDVIYGNAEDAAATMSQNFISVDSMKEFLAALGTQMGGTWSMGYENGKHTFTFTSN